MIEEAEKRDHRKLGREMDLFHFQEEGPGVVFWHPKGWTAVPEPHQPTCAGVIGKDGYKEVNAPQVLDTVAVGDLRSLGLVFTRTCSACRPPMPGQPEDMPTAGVRAQADELPGPRADLQARPEKLSRVCRCGSPNSACVHRYEPSGALHGLMRVRGFTQDDAHVFCTEEQLEDECMKINDLILSVYERLRLRADRHVKLVDPAGKARWEPTSSMGPCRAASC
jgi:threonyl-tRNA synthetase